MKHISVSDINSLPANLESRKIKLKAAVNILWQHIYENPAFYLLTDLEEDLKSDFLLSVVPKFPKYFEEYNKQKTFYFSCYVRNLLFYEKKSFIRILAKKNACELCRTAGFEEEYEENCDKYRNLEPENAVPELTDFNICDIFSKIKNEKQKEMAKDTVLYLLMKCCNSISDKHIKAASKLLEMDEGKLFNLIESVREKSEKRVSSTEKIIDRRNKYYFYKKRYKLELEKVSEDTSAYQQIRSKYDRQLSIWQNSIFCLSEKHSPTPTNASIAKVLEKDERTVSRYLNSAKKRQSITFEISENMLKSSSKEQK